MCDNIYIYARHTTCQCSLGYLSIHPSTYLSIHPSTYLSTYLSIDLSTYFLFSRVAISTTYRAPNVRDSECPIQVVEGCLGEYATQASFVHASSMSFMTGESGLRALFTGRAEG